MSATSFIRLLFDADILIKLSIFDCFTDCVEVSGFKVSECATMKSMTRSAGIDDPSIRDLKAGPGKPARRLFNTLRSIPTIDKMSQAEKELAAEINIVSQREGLQVDGGEALLISVSVHRQIPYLTTGDKKAVRSLPKLTQRIGAIADMKGRIIPLELLLLRLIQARGIGAVFDRLDAGKDRERTIANVIAEAGRDQSLFEAELMRCVASLQRNAPGFITV